MKTKIEGYTPGPWVFDPTCFESTIAVTPPESKLVIAEVWPMQADESGEDENYDIKTDPIANANARLIAAAPLLYETLRDLITVVQKEDLGAFSAIAYGPEVTDAIQFAALLLSRIDNDLL